MMHSTLIVAIAALPFINALTISKTGQCGASTQFTCKGSTFGSCCSQYGYCGKTSAYCGTGCNSKFGTCTVPAPSSAPASSSVRSSTRSSSTSNRASSTSTRSSSVSAPSSTLKVSTNARCGKGGFEAFTCIGSKYGDCCSQYSYCGSTDDYCSPQKKCQAGFGRCGPKPSSSSIRPSSSSSRALSLSTVVSTLSSSAFACSSGLVPSISFDPKTIGADVTFCVPTATPSSSSSQASSLTAVVSTLSSSAFACSSGLVPSISFDPETIGADVTFCMPTATPSSSEASSSAPSSSTETPTSTPTPTPTLTPIPSPTSSTPACEPTQTNAVQNGGFETGSLAPFTLASTGDWYYLDVSEGDIISGNYFYFGSSDSLQGATATLTQTGIFIPDGTVVDCSFGLEVNGNLGHSMRFEILLDGQSCGSTTVARTLYMKIGSQITVSGNVHVVTVTIVSSTTIRDVSNFLLDDVSITPVLGPGVDGGCPSTPTTPSQPGVTIP